MENSLPFAKNSHPALLRSCKIILMKAFSKKETPVQNLAFCAIIAAFDGILSLISALLPISAFFLMMIAPLLAALVAYFCKKRYYALYLFGAMGVSIAVSAWNFENTIFYLLPSLCAGLVYGFLLRRKSNVALMNFTVAMVQYVFFLLSLLLVKAIYEVDMREVIRSLFGLKSSDLLYDAFPLFALAYSFAVTGFSHLFFSLQAPHIGIEYSEEVRFAWLYPTLTVALSGLCIGFAFIYAKMAYFFLGCAFYWGFAALLTCFPKPHWSAFVTLGVCVFASILGFSICYGSLAKSQALLFSVLFAASMGLASFSDVLLGKKNKSI